MAKDGIKKSIYALKREIDEVINNYKEIPYGCGYNIGAEARRKSQLEKVKKALEEKSRRELEEFFGLAKAGWLKNL